MHFNDLYRDYSYLDSYTIKQIDTLMELTAKAIEYIKRTNSLFKVKEITTYRDGGTIVIECTKDKQFYGDKNKGTLHTSFPTNIDNRIFDPGLLDYISERLHNFLLHKKEEVKRLEYIINDKLIYTI